jgi:hypothetical protein
MSDTSSIGQPIHGQVARVRNGWPKLRRPMQLWAPRSRLAAWQPARSAQYGWLQIRRGIAALTGASLLLALPKFALGAGEDEFVEVPPVWLSESKSSLVRSPALCEALRKEIGDHAQWGKAGVPQTFETSEACKALLARDSGAKGRAYLFAHLNEALSVAKATVNVRTYCEAGEEGMRAPGAKPTDKEKFCTSIGLISGPTRGALRMSPPAHDEQEESFSSAMPVAQSNNAKLGGTPEQQFIEGLTNFILDRAKLEAILHFEERFRDKLCVPSPDAGAQVGYFHAVCNVLGNANEAGFSVAAASRELRAAARADLKELPDNVLHQKYVESGDYIWEMSRVWFALARALRDGRLPVDRIAEQLSNIDAAGLCARDANWPAGLPAALKAESMQATNRDKQETCSKALRALASVGKLLMTTDSLSAENVEPLALVDTLTFLVGDDPSSKFDEQKLSAFLDRIADLRMSVKTKNLKTKTLDGKTLDATATLNAWRAAASDARREMRREVAQILLDTADEFLTLTDAIASELSLCEKSGCGFDGSALRKPVARSVATVRKYDNIIVSIMENDWVNVASRFSELFLHEGRHQHQEAAIGRFAPVVSEIASAQTAVEVQSILNNAAAPAGSYREKFQNRTRSLTAFAGVSVGREKNDGNHQWGNTRGLFLPVGLHVTWPCERSCYGVGKGARGAFFSLIDLGPYVDYRDSGAGVDRDSRLGLRQLFAPGAYLTWNISTGKAHGSTWDELFYRSPFVFGIGVARAPALIDSVTGQRVDATRVQAFFAIDVTMFPF